MSAPISPISRPLVAAALLLALPERLLALDPSAAPVPPKPTFSVAEVITLETGGVPITAPKWSPDGQWIAYSLPKANGIGLIRADGSVRRVLTSETGSGYRFAWSPSGDRIAFRATQRDKGPRHYVIRTIDVASGEIEESTSVLRNAQPPTWQRGPQGERWISYSDAGVNAGTWRGLTSAKLTPPIVTPIALLERNRELRTIASPGSTSRKISGEFAINPVWNPAGTHVAYDAMDRIGVSEPSNPASSPRIIAVGQHPAWSPDGEWIAYQITRDHSHAPDDPRQHTPDTLPHLHDDKTNHQIVDSEIWVIGADGNNRHQLTATPDRIEVDPDWSPDGTAIVCRTEATGQLLILKLRKE